jgi:hypothetical protein
MVVMPKVCDVKQVTERCLPDRMTQMKEQRPDHLRQNTGIASLPIEGTATSNWAVIDAGWQQIVTMVIAATVLCIVLTGVALRSQSLNVQVL